MARILYIQYTNPGGYPPLEHSSRILADKSWDVIFLGTGALGADDLRFQAHTNITVRQMAFCTAGWRQKVHYLAYCLWVLWVTLTWRPKWVYASDPLACPVALILGWMPALKLIYHEHDTPAPGSHSSPFLSLVFRSRRAVAQRADLCILPNAKRLERFQNEFAPIRNTACVWNCPTLNEVAARPKHATLGHVWILYHGSIVPDRLSLAVVDALNLLTAAPSLRVVGYETVGHQGYVGELTQRAESLGITRCVEFKTPVPRSELFQFVENSDIGLALTPFGSTDKNFEAMTGASNKAFDYLAYGLPILVSDLPEWRQMFVDPGYALACDPGDPQSIAAAIRWLIEHPDRMRAMGEAGRQRIQSEWNYETQFQPVLEFMLGNSTAEFTSGKCVSMYHRLDRSTPGGQLDGNPSPVKD